MKLAAFNIRTSAPVLVGLLLASAGAQAADLTLSYTTTSSGTSGPGSGTILPVPGSHTFGNTLGPSSTGIPGSPAYEFYDDYVFQITGAVAQVLTSSINLGESLGLENFQVRLFSFDSNPVLPVFGPPAGGTLLQAWSTALNLGPGQTGSYAVIAPTVLAAGTYVLEVRGNVSGAFGGSYAGIANLAPIPLPAALPMLLSGLGAFGFWARRRRTGRGAAAPGILPA